MPVMTTEAGESCLKCSASIGVTVLLSRSDRQRFSTDPKHVDWLNRPWEH